MTAPPDNAPVYIYHIVHVDRLQSIIESGCIYSYAEAAKRGIGGTNIGIGNVKDRRRKTELNSHPGLRVGDCVPFNFCPRSYMLHVIHKKHLGEITTELEYSGGQKEIVHLLADLHDTVNLANRQNRKWVITSGNATANHSKNYADLSALREIDWDAVNANLDDSNWSKLKGGKQAEFLVERSFPWSQVRRVGVFSEAIETRVKEILKDTSANPTPFVCVEQEWYY